MSQDRPAEPVLTEAQTLALLKKKKKADHEAAHAVLLDEIGYDVLFINIAANKMQQTKADWKGFDKKLATINWNNAAELAENKPKILDLLAMYVAGHLVEHDGLDPTEPLVSDRIDADLLAAGNFGNSDRDRVCWLLKLIKCSTKAHILAAEANARDVLGRRQAHFRAIADKLVQSEYVDGTEMRVLLGK